MSPGQFDQLDQLGQPGQQRSNPSTASSTYLNRAQDMMSRIKERNVSPSTSTTANESPRYPRRQLSESSRDTYQSSDAKETMPVTSSRAMVVQPMSSESDMSIEDEGEEADEEETEGEPGQPIRLSGSRTSVEGAGLPGQLQANRDDLNRFMSTSTYTTGTTVSTSFVKHAGPRDAARAPAMTHIAPGDVPPELVQRVGGMRFDRKANRWVRDANGNGSLGRVDEAGESRTNGSDESSDVFAGIDSIHSGERTRGSSVAARSLPRNTLPPVMDELDTTEDDVVEDVDSTPRPPRRPPIAHAYSAPVPKTPNLKPPAGPATPLVLRSALRNANANAAPSSAMKKQAAWHPDLGERSYTKRSVSFSDNYIAPPRGNPSKQASSAEKEDDDDDDEEDGYGQENTNNNRSASWMPSARTKRIQAVLAGMEDMTLADGVADGTPSKASRDQSARQYRALPRAVHSSPSMVTESETNDDDTIEPVPFGASARSFRGAADATFLTECSFGVAHDRLLQVITDVQPFEPYWEQLRTIDLSKKGIDSVVRLKEFLPQLDEANLEENVISYLSGIPATVRTLHVAGNALSSLTSVNHLRNLQYLDLSRNELDSVSQLECLRHLRELKLDHNVIKDLSGIMSMDSLQRLSAVGNKIEQLDLSTARWEKLESLNLSKNKIRSITGLHRLQSIGSLNLDHNKFTDLDSTVPLERIRSLRFCDNDITYIDLSHFPKLRTLFADNNALPGLSRSMSTGGHRIENLSVRNQRVGHLTLLAEDLQSVKRLYLSGNRLDPDFLPRSPLFHLVYLEAAACNISSWPTNFAQRAPNLRILNVNYNFLTDLDGLSGMVLLRKLMAVGNRLGAGGPAAVRGLGGLTELEEMDMRMNPVTLSFYLPIMMPNADKPPKASGDGGGSGAVPADGNWPSLDAQFRRQLPDEWYSKRLLYRGLVMASCPDLRTLDGIKISDGERRKAAMLLEYAGATA
jgi:Leucine-rich repeat (LRR) protein